jgi:hypothetical protein
MSSSRDFGFITLRSIQAYQPNGARVPPNYILSVGTDGAGGFTNNVYVSSFQASSIVVSTICARTIVDISTIDVSTIYTSTIDAFNISASTTITNYLTVNSTLNASTIDTDSIYATILNTSLIKYVSTAEYPNPSKIIQFDAGGPEYIYLNHGTSTNTLNLMGGVSIQGDRTSGGDLYLNASTSTDSGITTNNIFMNNPTTITINQPNYTSSALTLFNNNTSQLTGTNTATAVAFSMSTSNGEYTWYNTASTSGNGGGLSTNHLQLFSYFPGPSSILDITPAGNMSIPGNFDALSISTVKKITLINDNLSTVVITNNASTIEINGFALLTQGTISSISSLYWSADSVAGYIYNTNLGKDQLNAYLVGIGVTSGTPLNATLDVQYQGTGVGNVFNLKDKNRNNLLTVDNAGNTKINGTLSTSLINMSNTSGVQGQIVGLSTINGLRWNPGDDAFWSSDNGGVDIYSDNTRNVGIGTTNPGAKLDVAGNANISSGLTVNNNLNVTSTITILGTDATTQFQLTSQSGSFALNQTGPGTPGNMITGNANQVNINTQLAVNNGNNIIISTTNNGVTIGGYTSTSLINMSNTRGAQGQIVGLSTINGTAWPPVNNDFWTTSQNGAPNISYIGGNVGIKNNTPVAPLVVRNESGNYNSGIALNSGDVYTLVGNTGNNDNYGTIQVTAGGNISSIGTSSWPLILQPQGGGDGRVGIATTSYPQATLDVAGNIIASTGFTTGNTSYLAGPTINASYPVNSTVLTYAYDNTDGKDTLVIAPPGTARSKIVFKTASANNTVATEAIRIKENTFVGIGNIDPAYQLDVNGNARISGTLSTSNVSTTTLTVTNGATISGQGQFLANVGGTYGALSIKNASTNNSAVSIDIGTGTNKYSIVQTAAASAPVGSGLEPSTIQVFSYFDSVNPGNGTETLRIYPNGRMNVTNTLNVAGGLNVNSGSININDGGLTVKTALSTNTINMTSGQINGLSTINNIAWPPVNNDFWAGTLTGNIYNDNSLNVGIGIPTPTEKLTVNSTILIKGPNNGTSRLILGPSPGTNNYDYCSAIEANNTQSDNYGSDLRFFTHQTATTSGPTQERMRIDNIGNVGIGNTSPQATLDVTGNVNISSNLTVGTAPNNGLARTTINGYLGINKNAGYQFDCQGDAAISGTLYLPNNLASNNVSTTSLIVRDNATVGGLLTVNNNLNVTSALQISSANGLKSASLAESDGGNLTILSDTVSLYGSAGGVQFYSPATTNPAKISVSNEGTVAFQGGASTIGDAVIRAVRNIYIQPGTTIDGVSQTNPTVTYIGGAQNTTSLYIHTSTSGPGGTAELRLNDNSITGIQYQLATTGGTFYLTDTKNNYNILNATTSGLNINTALTVSTGLTVRSNISIVNNSSGTGSNNISFNKSNSGGQTLNNSELGYFNFNGTLADGLGSSSRAAAIYAIQDGNAANNFVPGKIQFHTTGTTPNVNDVPPLRMIINSAGNVGIGTDNPAYKLDVAGNARISDTLSTSNISTTVLTVTSGATVNNGLTVTGVLTANTGAIITGYTSTSLINMTTNGLNQGQIVGLSTINGISWPSANTLLANTIFSTNSTVTLSNLINNPSITGNVQVNILAIGGGGGGANGWTLGPDPFYYGGGGGGSGQEVSATYYLPVNTNITFTIGSGGNGGPIGVNGGNTTVSSLNNSNIALFAVGGEGAGVTYKDYGGSGYYGGGSGGVSGGNGSVNPSVASFSYIYYPSRLGFLRYTPSQTSNRDSYGGRGDSGARTIDNGGNGFNANVAGGGGGGISILSNSGSGQGGQASNMNGSNGSNGGGGGGGSSGGGFPIGNSGDGGAGVVRIQILSM